jgi:hypothetical protein
MIMLSPREYLVLSVVMLAVPVAASAGAAVGTGAGVAVSVGASVGTAVGVSVSVGAAVGTAVAVGASVGVSEGIAVAVTKSAGVSVAAIISATVDLFDSIRPDTNRATPKRSSRIGLRFMIGFLLAVRCACLLRFARPAYPPWLPGWPS